MDQDLECYYIKVRCIFVTPHLTVGSLASDTNCDTVEPLYWDHRWDR